MNQQTADKVYNKFKQKTWDKIVAEVNKDDDIDTKMWHIYCLIKRSYKRCRIANLPTEF
jgi:hypothetical protein